MDRQFQLAGMYWLDNADAREFQSPLAYVNEDETAAPGGTVRPRSLLTLGVGC